MRAHDRSPFIQDAPSPPAPVNDQTGGVVYVYDSGLNY